MESVKAKTAPTITASDVAPAKSDYTSADGRYTYSYDRTTSDPVSAAATGDAQNPAVLTVNYVYGQADDFRVAYEYVSGTQGKELPAAILDTTPTDDAPYKVGAIVTRATPSMTSYDVMEGNVTLGTWTLTNWNPADASVSMTKDGVKFTGTWTYADAAKYGVTYRHTAASGTLPEAIGTQYAVRDARTFLVNENVTRSADATPVNTSYQVTNASGLVTGTWTLTKWDAAEKTMAKDGIEFVATWTYEAAAKYGVIYRYVAASGTLPSEISTTTGAYAVSDSSTYLVGEAVGLVGTAKPIGTTYNVYENGLVSGTWTLSQWSKSSSTMTSSGVTITGTWTYQAAARYGVNYRYVAASGTLPSEISTTTGTYAISDSTRYLNGATVSRQASPADGAAYNVVVNGLIEGTWTLSWDRAAVAVHGADVEFVGTWTYRAAARYGVSYAYTAAPGSPALPEAISTDSGAYAVSDTVKYLNGAAVNLVQGAPAVNTAHTVKSADDSSVVLGTWTLTSWSDHPTTMTTSGVTFTGTWTYEAAAKYAVTYEYVSGTEGKELPADIKTTEGTYAVSDAKTYYVNQTVARQAAPAEGATYTAMDGDVALGTWTLRWNLSDAKMTASGVKFIGTWTYAAATPYGVTYAYQSGTTGMDLPAVISTASGDYAVSDSDTYLANRTVNRKNTVPAGTKYDVKNASGLITGTWTLTGWDKDSAKMSASGVTFTGTWTYEAAAKYAVTYEYVSGTEGKELPAAISTASGDYAVSDSKTYLDGATVSRVVSAPKIGTQYLVKNAQNLTTGTWTLTKWEPADDAAVKQNGVTFTATWTYQDAETYGVIYEYVKAEGTSKDLPQAISTLAGDYAVSDTDRYLTGATVSLASAAKPVDTTKYTDAANDGVWTLTKWSENPVTMTASGVKFIGTWSFAPNSHPVSYSWSGTIPSDAEKPAGSDNHMGDTVNVNTKYPAGSRSGSLDGVPGTYTFTGWSTSDAILSNGSFAMPNHSVTLTGVWSFTPNGKATVTINYVNETGDPIIPAEVSAPDYVGSGYEATLNTKDIPAYYTFKKTTGDALKGTLDSSKVITAHYTLNSYSYVVKYVNDYTAQELHTTDAHSRPYGTVLTSELIAKDLDNADWIDAYRPDGYRSGTVRAYLTIAAEGNVVEVHYNRDGGTGSTEHTVTVNYVDEAGNALRPSYTTTVSGGAKYDVTDKAQLAIAGYTRKEVKGDALIGWAGSDRVITVVYAADETNIDDGDTPKGETPDTGKPDGGTVEIDDTSVPKGDKPADTTEITEDNVPMGDAPATGDNNTLAILMVVALISSLGMGALVLTGKRGKKHN